MSVNNQLITDKRPGRNGVKFLDPRIREWRAVVDQRIKELGITWRPQGVVAGIIVFESPIWVTKKHTIKKADADNRIKATFDAIALSTGSDDAHLWEGHFYKLFGRREITHVWLFDLGDVVEGSRPA